jgi:hypothetical protein
VSPYSHNIKFGILKTTFYFKHSDQDIIAVVTPKESHFFLANPELCKEVMVNRWQDFPKPIHTYDILDIYVRGWSNHLLASII